MAEIPVRDVTNIRLHRELTLLSDKAKQNSKYTFDHFPSQNYILINKVIKIVYGKSFPFEPP